MIKICPVCKQKMVVDKAFKNAVVSHGKCAYEACTDIRKNRKDEEEYRKRFRK